MPEKCPSIKVRTSTHLAHGLRSHLYPDGTFRLGPIGNKAGIQIDNVDLIRFGELIVQMQLLIVGIERFDDATGDRIEWLAAASDEANATFGARPDRIWSEIGNRAAKEFDDRAEDLCSAISFHYIAAEISIRRVSEAYHFHQRRAHRDKTPVGHRFSMMDTYELHNDLHTLFVNLGSVRDYAASFISEKISGLGQVSNHAALLKRIRQSDEEIHRLVRTYSERSYAPIGLAHIGEYRDILVHRSPVGNLNDWVDVVPLRKPLPSGHGGISLRLPASPFDLDGDTVDALVLIHHAQLLMAKYLIEVTRASPITPYRPHFRVVDGRAEEIEE